jgi:hypothetical protein
LSERIARVASDFCVPEANVTYIFEGPENVDGGFRDSFWDEKKQVRQSREGLAFPLSQIYPLFRGIDPYYWAEFGAQGGRQSFYPEISDDRLHEEAKNRIVTPFETIVDLVRSR